MRPLVTALFLSGTAYAALHWSGFRPSIPGGCHACVCVTITMACDAPAQSVGTLQEEVRQLKPRVDHMG